MPLPGTWKARRRAFHCRTPRRRRAADRPGDYYEPEVRGRAAEEITLRRLPPPRRRFSKLEALRAIEKSPLRFTHSWDQVKEETRR